MTKATLDARVEKLFGQVYHNVVTKYQPEAAKRCIREALTLPPVEPADGGEARDLLKDAGVTGDTMADALSVFRHTTGIDADAEEALVRWDALRNRLRDLAKEAPEIEWSSSPTPEPLPAGLEERARELLAAEYKRELAHIYDEKVRDKKTGIVIEIIERPWSEWLQMADNSPASLAAIRKALSSPVAEMGVNEGLICALGEAAFTFETYAKMHAAKGTSEGHEKAAKNAKMAERCRAAIAAARLNHRPMTAEVALTDVAAERRRQIEAEGWTPEHDDEHADGSLAVAAACYAAPERVKATTDYEQRHGVPGDYAHVLRWPWEGEPKVKDRRSNLIRSAALIIAEIERLDRASLNTEPAR